MVERFSQYESKYVKYKVGNIPVTRKRLSLEPNATREIWINTKMMVINYHVKQNMISN
jgi:hypothetical protein